MGHFRGILAIGLAMACALCVQAKRAAADEPGQLKPCELDRAIHVKLKYLLYLPKDYDAQKSVPMMLFLHGMGERGDDLELVKKHGPPKQIAAGQKFPCIVVAPQCPLSRSSWEPFELSALLDEIVEKYNVDQDRIYVTGISMGGFGAWALAIASPERFAAAVPICGGGDPAWAVQLVDLPLWVFHGAKDKSVPLERSERMVEVVKRYGGNVKFTVYPELTHDCWTVSYANPELYEWLFQQKRGAKRTEPSK
jgi:predicted peptidase